MSQPAGPEAGTGTPSRSAPTCPRGPVLVTGANGFVGRHVVAELLRHGSPVRAMIQPGTDGSCLGDDRTGKPPAWRGAGGTDDEEHGPRTQEAPTCVPREVAAPPAAPQEELAASGRAGRVPEVVAADLTDPEALRAAVAGCSGVVHLAALVQDWGSLPRFERVNVQGTRDLLDAAVAAGVGRFLLVSSMAVHLDGDFVDGTEDAPRDPRGNAYAWSKIRCEDLLAEAHASGRIETVVVRPAMIIYGEWDTRSLPGLLPLLRKGRMPVSGTDRRLTCAVYAGNLAHGIRLALESPAAAGRTYVITDDTKLTWGDFFDGLADAMGVAHPGRTRIPAPLAAAAGTVVEAVWALLRLRSRPPLTRYLARLTCRDTHFACDRAKAELSYAPVTSPGDALRATVRWYASA